MPSSKAALPGAGRIVICDYNSLLQTVSGLLRMSGYAVFQAYNGHAAEELCAELHGIALAVLHIGKSPIPGMPSNVRHLTESFTADELLETVRALVPGHPDTRAVASGAGEYPQC